MEKNKYKKLHRLTRVAVTIHWKKGNAKWIEMIDKNNRWIFDIVFYGKNPKNLEPYYNSINKDYELRKHWGL